MNTYLLRDLITRKLDRNFISYSFKNLIQHDCYTISEIVEIMRQMTSYGVMKISNTDMDKMYKQLLSDWYEIEIKANKTYLYDMETGLVTIIYLDLNSSWLVDYLIEMAV